MESYFLESYARQYQAARSIPARIGRRSTPPKAPLLYRLGSLLIAVGAMLQRRTQPAPSCRR